MSTESDVLRTGHKSGPKQFLAMPSTSKKGSHTKHKARRSDSESDEAREIKPKRSKHSRNHRQASSSSSEHSSSSISSSSNSSSSSSEKLRVSKHNSSKKYIEYSQRKNKVPSTEAIYKLIKKFKLVKHLSPHKHAIVLYLVTEVQESSFMSMMGDLNEKSLQQFLTFMRSKADEVLNTLMVRYQFSLEEQHQTDLILNDSQQSLSKAYTKSLPCKMSQTLSKAFDKYSLKIIEKGGLLKRSKGDSKYIENLMFKVRKVASKALLKQLKKQSTANSLPEDLEVVTLKEEPQVSPQQIESNFHMIYYGEFLTKINEEGALVKKLYAEGNPVLITLLSNYQKPADYEALKKGIYDLIM